MSARRAAPAGPASQLRRKIELSTGPLLVMLHRLPRPVVGLAPAVLLVLGIVLPPGAALVPLVLALILLGWLSYLSWPIVPTQGRAIRLLTLAVLVAVAGWRIAQLTSG